jgi:hypothetical protein
LLGGLFVVAIKDAIFVLPSSARLALLLLLVLGSVGVCAVLATRPWRNAQLRKAAGERIDRVAEARQQPVTVGLSLEAPMDDDSLALMLLQRAETRASRVAADVKPAQAYPSRRLTAPGGWLAFAMGLWLVLALLLPTHVLGLVSRVLMPWSSTPPFSLTTMEPQWQPTAPTVGDDVWLSVEPRGRMPEEVDWVRLDERGKEAERFAMQSDRSGGFTHRLSGIDGPVAFRLEAFGRPTQAFTITPLLRSDSSGDLAEADTESSATRANAEAPDGTTRFDADQVGRRDLDASEDWQAIKADVRSLIYALDRLKAQAQSVDPADDEALGTIAAQSAELAEQAEQLAKQLAAVRDELSAEASALLDDLASALASMQTAAIAAPPESAAQASASGQTSSADWLGDVVEAAEADRQAIGQGLGPSERPTESGLASGAPGLTSTPRDPSTSGVAVETTAGGDSGPLPDAAMQRVPPSYRDLVSVYFERVANDASQP